MITGRRTVHRPRRPPRIRAAGVVIGAPNGSVIRHVIRRAINPVVTFCYQKALTRHPRLQGTIVVRFVIGLRGRVTSAKIAQGMSAPGLESCVVKAVEATRFPRPSGGITVVLYPFGFRPGP